MAITKLFKDGGHKNIVQIIAHGWFTSLPYPFYFVDMELCDVTLHDYIHNPSIEVLDGNTSTSQSMITVDPKDIVQSTLGVVDFNMGSITDTANWYTRLRNIWVVMRDITGGVEFIHYHKHVHRDLKPRNGAAWKSYF